MMDRERIDYLLDRYADLNWIAQEKQELEQLLLNSAQAREWFWNRADLLTILREAHSLDSGREMAEIDIAPLEFIGSALNSAAICNTDPGIANAKRTPAPFRFLSEVISIRGAGSTLPWLYGVVTVAMLVGAGLTYWLTNWDSHHENRERHVAHSLERGDASSLDANSYAATLASVTNCRWDSVKSTADLRDGSRLQPGESLNLLEGIAEIVCERSSGGTGRLGLEGPLAMVVTGDSMPVLQYGKLSAVVAPDSDVFMLGTPLGQVAVLGDASLGVVAAANDVTVHVFAGDAVFELLWAGESPDNESRYAIPAGVSLRLKSDSQGRLGVTRGDANERCFVVNVAMSADPLHIADEYVSAVQRAKPLAYWRFESEDGNHVRNEVSDRLHLRIRGTVGWRDYPGNRSVEFGVRRDTGYLLTDDSIGNEIESAYTVEAWVKASHIHSGVLMGLVDWSSDAPAVVRHGLQLELLGPVGPWSNVKPESTTTPRSPMHPRFHPERIRFLHRGPAGADVNTGTSCYSQPPYAVRSWQHLVGVKDHESLQLYVNGERVATQKDPTDSSHGLRVIIGQVFPSGVGGRGVVRQLVGELDEVAIYGRALSESEIRGHYDLGKDSSVSPDDNLLRKRESPGV